VKMLKCPICGRMKETARRNKTCSRKCGAELVMRRLGGDYFQALGRKAGGAGAKQARIRAIATWQARFPGVPAPAALRIYSQGYGSGHKVGRRSGFAEGYEAALQDMREVRREKAKAA
jgi:hypothetical protein